jgi:hypothetical protein
MVKTAFTNPTPIKQKKITLDFITSSDDSTSNIPLPNCTNRLNRITRQPLDALRRRHEIRKRLNKVKRLSFDKQQLTIIAYSEQNKQMALEIDKMKHILQFKDSKIFDLEREKFELQEYVNELEVSKFDMMSKSKNYDAEQNIDFRFISDFLKLIQDRAGTIDKSLAPYLSSTTRQSSLNNITMNRTSTSDNSKFALLSPLDIPIESLNKMQQLAVENSIKLQKRRDELVAKDKMVTYDFEDDDSLNVELKEEIEQQQQQQPQKNLKKRNCSMDECNGLTAIREENEDEFKIDDNELDELYDEFGDEILCSEEEEEGECYEDEEEEEEEGEGDEDEEEEEGDEDEDEMVPDEEETELENEDETGIEDGTINESKDWVMDFNNKKNMKTYENKLLKKVSFGLLSTPPRELIQSDEFDIYTDANSIDDEQQRKNKASYYEELENRPVIVNLNNSKPKRIVYTPKRIMNKKVIIEDDNSQEKLEVDVKNNDEEQVNQESVFIKPKIRKNSTNMKKSLDRRRSQAFSPIESPNNIVIDDHEPHIQPIDVSNDVLEAPKVDSPEKVSKKVGIIKNLQLEANDLNVNTHVKQNKKKVVIFEEKQQVEETIDAKYEKPVKKPEVISEIDKENEPQLKNARRNNRSKSKLISQEEKHVEASIEKAEEHQDNGEKQHSEIETAKVKAPTVDDPLPTSPQKIIKINKNNIKNEVPAEIGKPPIAKKVNPKKEKVVENNPNATYVIENSNDEENTRILNEVMKKLEVEKNIQKNPLTNRVLNEVSHSCNTKNENIDPLSSYNAENLSISSKKRCSNEKANISEASNAMESLRSADSSINKYGKFYVL